MTDKKPSSATSGSSGHIPGAALSTSPKMLATNKVVQPGLQNANMIAQETSDVESTQHCRMPPFWRTNPELWFFQIESIFQTNRIRSDLSKYHLVVSALDPDSLQDIADILKSPAAANLYTYLKEKIMSRFTDSADRQLQKLLTELELGDKKPSQLLRQMRSLAGNQASEDLLRVKWLALLPPNTERFLKIFRAPSLEELATAADELIEGLPSSCIMSASSHPRHTSPSHPTSGAHAYNSSALVENDLIDIKSI